MRTAVVLVVLVLSTAACGSRGADREVGVLSAPSPDPRQHYVGVGTVIERGQGPRLCLGPVAESWPPQCEGVPLEGWRWQDVRHESSQGTRWGGYAVTGTWDGVGFRQTAPPVPVALFDPPPQPAPPGPPAEPLERAELERLQRELGGLPDLGLLTSHVADGQVVLEVVLDDGTLQDRLDESLGRGVVRVVSALRPAGE